MVLSTTSTGTLSIVVLTWPENSSKSYVKSLFPRHLGATSFWKHEKYFQGWFETTCRNRKLLCFFLSETDLFLQLFCDGSPSCKNSFPFGLEHFLNVLGKSSQTKEEKCISMKYCSAANSPFPYAIAAINCDMLLPVSLWLTFAVKPKSNSCAGFLLTITTGALAWWKGFILWIKLAPSK